MHRLALILVLTSACVANSGDEGFNIVHNLAPTGNCELTPGSAFLARGLIDKQSPNPYVLTPEFVSRISAQEGNDFQRTIALRGANVEVKNAQTNTSLGKFKTLFAASLSPMGSTTAAFDIITTDILQSSGATGTTRVQLVARVVPFGALGGSGDNIDGVPFEYPVTVCDGCVANILGDCPLAFGTEVPEDMANPCNAFQDGVVHCCMSASGPVCPPTVAGQSFALTVVKAGSLAGTATVTSAPAGITCGASCTGTFTSGASVTLTVAGAATVTWTGATGCTTGTTCVVAVDAIKTVNVTLEP